MCGVFFSVTGFVYGAKENKKLKVFIDDINLPSAQQDGVQRCNEVGTTEIEPKMWQLLALFVTSIFVKTEF